MKTTYKQNPYVKAEFQIIDEENGHLVSVNKNNFGSDEEAEAYTKLLSLAPNMLKELVCTKDAIYELMEYQDGWEADLQRIEDLIEKATEL